MINDIMNNMINNMSNNMMNYMISNMINIMISNMIYNTISDLPFPSSEGSYEGGGPAVPVRSEEVPRPCSGGDQELKALRDLRVSLYLNLSRCRRKTNVRARCCRDRGAITHAMIEPWGVTSSDGGDGGSYFMLFSVRGGPTWGWCEHEWTSMLWFHAAGIGHVTCWWSMTFHVIVPCFWYTTCNIR